MESDDDDELLCYSLLLIIIHYSDISHYFDVSMCPKLITAFLVTGLHKRSRSRSGTEGHARLCDSHEYNSPAYESRRLTNRASQ